MTPTQQMITIGMAVLATMLTRFLPFLLFPEGKKTPPFVQYIGKVLPGAVFGMLIVYCLKDVQWLHGAHSLPEIIAIAAIVLLHLWKKQTLLSIGAGTILYMLLVQFVF